QRQSSAALEVEARAVARADDRAGLDVPEAETERPVVVGAAILDREQLACTVVNTYVVRLVLHELHRPRRQLLERSHGHLTQRSAVPLRRAYGSKSRPCHSSGSGVPFERLSATFTTPSPRIAHFMRTGVSRMPTSSRISSSSSATTRRAVLSLRRSIRRSEAACGTAPPRTSS